MIISPAAAHLMPSHSLHQLFPSGSVWDVYEILTCSKQVKKTQTNSLNDQCYSVQYWLKINTRLRGSKFHVSMDESTLWDADINISQYPVTDDMTIPSLVVRPEYTRPFM